MAATTESIKLESEKYGWRRIITKVFVVSDEIKLINDGDDERHTDGFTFSITNTQKMIANGTYTHTRREGLLPNPKK